MRRLHVQWVQQFVSGFEIWSFLRFLECNFRQKNRFFKIALSARLSGSFYRAILKNRVLAENFTPKTSKMTKLRSRTQIVERTVVFSEIQILNFVKAFEHVGR